MINLQKNNNTVTLSNSQTLVIGGLILALIFLTYRNMLDNFFVGDDFPWLYHVIKMRHHFLDELWERYTWMGSSILFYLNILMFGTKAWGYNATNLLVHLGNVILVGLLGYFITRQKLGGLLVMLLWGISAQGTEAILWKTGRGHTVVLFFMLGSIVAFLAWDQKRQPWQYALTVLCAICAQLTLFNAAILPGVVCAYLLVFKGIPRTLRQGVKYLKFLFPFLLITGIYLFLYLFIYTPLSTSQYYNFEDSLILKFGKYVFNYLSIFPDYFIHITYDEKMFSYCGIATVVAFIAALLFIKNKAIRFSLIFMVLTMLPYLPVPLSGNYQPSRYRYTPLVGFSIILAVALLQLRNITFSSQLVRRLVGVLGVGFVLLFVIGNIYYIVLDELDYDRYGKVHHLLVDKAQAIVNRLPVDRTIVFANFSKVNAPARVLDEVYRPKAWFVRGMAPWKLIYIEHLLTFCIQTNKGEGIFTIQDKDEALQNIHAGKHTLLAFSHTDFHFPTFTPEQIEQQIIPNLGSQDSLRHIMPLQYVAPDK